MKRLIPLLCFSIFLSCTQKKVEEKRKDSVLYKKAFDYKKAEKLDSAFLFFNQAKDNFLSIKDSLGVGKCLANMGIISTQSGDYFGGQETALNAIQYFNLKNEKQHIYILANYNNLGLATEYLGNYSKAIFFYEKSLLYTAGIEANCVVKNNIANVYRSNLDYAKAISIYSALLKQPISEIEYARILSNLAFTQWLANPKYNPLPQLFKALKIREKHNDLWGLNSSYAALSDYYFDKNPDSALRYANNMYQKAQQINSANDQMQALKKLIKLNKPQDAKNNFILYYKLDDSIKKAQSIAKNQFAVIRYETEKHKADNLVLQTENIEKQQQISYQKIELIISILFLFSCAVIAVLWYKKRKQKIDLETQNAIRVNELKTSRKVHDVVANGIYRVMAEIENQDYIDRERILDKLENMYEKSRDISYDNIPVSKQYFNEKISNLLTSFATENIKILITGNSFELWQKVSIQVQFEIEHILQELLVNMKKHSGANNVVIRFENINDFINIYYADDGKGMVKSQIFNNGLKNTGNRINSIGGHITFDTELEKGLKIHISFSVN